MMPARHRELRRGGQAKELGPCSENKVFSIRIKKSQLAKLE